MAQRAGHGDPLEAGALDGEADGKPLSFLPGKPEGAIAAESGLPRPVALRGIARDEIGKDPGQDHENGIGNPGDGVAAQRAVFESLRRVREALILAP